ncbi:hypothetical protein WT97_11250 [Burkholderia sp. MSMB1459WGS]|uniref:hypothetical protein n=1 Tax=unclassified Burkholderia TaxID=2613784 RepID=UPI0007566618|nr:MULTISPECIES: hypothetical protein [unclassified Burkholderia]KVT06056.1 hypothetical protein WT24_02090 [Burkholderia sp. MSMB1078WGS]KWO45685.1 hypothetical protein WT97_11250 [Burkholderia sp. MSMB1459WGS]
MIGAQARAGFERIFFDAARTRLASGGACDIRPATGHEHDAPDRLQATSRSKSKAPEYVVVLTISALHFRLLLALRFSDDDATRRHFVGTAAGAGNARPLTDAFMEAANLCCGAINQALTAPFPDLGMSTPYLLSGASIDYMHALSPDYVAAYDLTFDDVRVGATLCVCANAPVDFHVPEAATVETGGELELF